MASPFDSLVPTPAQLQAKLDEWRAALIAADEGTKADTYRKNAVRAELEAMLTLQAQNSAEIAAGNLTLYLSTGYDAKDTQGKPTGVLPRVEGVALAYGDSEGEIKIKWLPMAVALNFTVQVVTDAADPVGSLIKQFVLGKIG